MTTVVLSGQCLLALAAALAVACAHHHLHMTPAELDKMHHNCEERMRRGDALASRSGSVGRIAPAKPPGTPVVVYGAGWCEACDVAKAYMKRRGIPFVEYDVESSPEAKPAMDATLVKAGLPVTTSLPVMDVRGTITVGFIPCVLEAAWAKT